MDRAKQKRLEAKGWRVGTVAEFFRSKKMAAFYGNSKTHVLHNAKKKDACRASEILDKNRKSFNSVETAKVAGYRLCKVCFAENQ